MVAADVASAIKLTLTISRKDNFNNSLTQLQTASPRTGHGTAQRIRRRTIISQEEPNDSQGYYYQVTMTYTTMKTALAKKITLSLPGLVVVLLLMMASTARSAEPEPESMSGNFIMQTGEGDPDEWPCSVPLIEGFTRGEGQPCAAVTTRWYYNSVAGTCFQFVHGGCHGNTNNFASESECLGACGRAYGKGPGTCSLPPEVGMGRAEIDRFYYDQETGECTEFGWGGMGGNANRFLTSRECLDACADPCSLPKIVGPGRVGSRRFYYNPDVGKCLEFTYGGSGGNANNFRSISDCVDACGN